jgi:hypothetical protein
MVTAFASQAALPGDSLYSVKTAIEETQMLLAWDTADETRLHLKFAERRLDEIEALIADVPLEHIAAATDQFSFHLEEAAHVVNSVAASDTVQSESLTQLVADTSSGYTQALSELLTSTPDIAQPAIKRALQTWQMRMHSTDDEYADIEGTVERIDHGTMRLAVDGMAFWADAHTEIDCDEDHGGFDRIQVGDWVKVEYRTRDNYVTEIELETDENDGDSRDRDDSDRDHRDDDGQDRER